MIVNAAERAVTRRSRPALLSAQPSPRLQQAGVRRGRSQPPSASRDDRRDGASRMWTRRPCPLSAHMDVYSDNFYPECCLKEIRRRAGGAAGSAAAGENRGPRAGCSPPAQASLRRAFGWSKGDRLPLGRTAGTAGRLATLLREPCGSTPEYQAVTVMGPPCHRGGGRGRLGAPACGTGSARWPTWRRGKNRDERKQLLSALSGFVGDHYVFSIFGTAWPPSKDVAYAEAVFKNPLCAGARPAARVLEAFQESASERIRYPAFGAF